MAILSLFQELFFAKKLESLFCSKLGFAHVIDFLVFHLPSRPRIGKNSHPCYRYWHVRCIAVGCHLATDCQKFSGHYFCHFFTHFFFVSSMLSTFPKEECSNQKPWGIHLSRPCWPFLGPLGAILVLQAVRRGGEHQSF